MEPIKKQNLLPINNRMIIYAFVGIIASPFILGGVYLYKRQRFIHHNRNMDRPIREATFDEILFQ